MLAKLLRGLILVQVLTGAGLGYLIFRDGKYMVLATAVLAVTFPFLTMILVDAVSATKARPNESAAHWWRSLFGEILAGFTVFLFRQPWATSPPSLLSATSGAPKVPVVLVHGYLCNHRIWDDMVRTLRSSGHAVFAVDLEPLFTSIDNYVPIVETAVEQLRHHTGAPKVVLLGHSMGGLAIRAWMRAQGNDRVARVITLGTPHAGTQIHPRTSAPNGRQMVWKSPWLAQLAESESADVRALMRIAIAAQDNIVYPQRAQTFDGMEAAVFEGIGHVQMCLDPHVIHWVLEQLSQTSE